MSEKSTNHSSPESSRSTRNPVPPAVVIQQGEHAMGAAAAAAAAEESAPTSPGPHQHHRRRTTFHHEQPIEDVPPPPYDSGHYGQLDISQNGLDTGARVGKDGRVNIRIKEKSRRVTEILAPLLVKHSSKSEPEPAIPEGLGYMDDLPPPPMNIVIQIVGSRGDVQPFVALGQVLKEKFNHRVRIATHSVFRQFITENGLEFFSIGGDPAELMAFMVKNPGLMPGLDTLKSGDIGKRRKTIYEMINGCWRSCIEAGDGTGMAASDDLFETQSVDSAISMGDPDANKPFIADAIIANPVSFAHISVAEKLGIPLHLMFTMPWSPTQAFPHPLANILSSNTDQSLANYISYSLVEMLTWQGLGDLINKFRERVLHLEPVSIIWAPGMLSRLKIPYTYCWSPALIPKPRDWGNHIDISGFFFLNLSSNYTPPADLAEFLDAGPPPVYIGFGSIVVDDPTGMTKMIFEAIRKTGQRALVSKGWGGIGADELGIPEGVLMLGNCPHDWLFKRVSCVVHHGGAGTTAAGIAAGRPTMVVPFFGDQAFWGGMINRAGAGPKPIAYKNLTADNLAASIMECLKPESLEKAAQMSERIKQEHGTETGADSFHKQLQRHELRCSICPGRIAVWEVRKTNIRLSALAATVLGNEGLLDFEDLRLYRPCEYDVDEGPPEPISGGAAALIGTLSEMGVGVADVPGEILRSMKFGEYKRKEQLSSNEATPPETLAAPSIMEPDSRRSSVGGQPVTESKGKQNENASDSQAGPDDPKTEPDKHPVASPDDRTGAMASVMTPDGSPRRRWSVGSSRRGSTVASPARSRSRSPFPATEKAGQITLDSIVGATKAGGKIVGVGLKSPMDFTMSLAQGFHNAPKLYGDTTVRKQARVTDLQSGLKAAGKEFGYGFYDGITGLITQPIQGARKEGAAGFMKGMFRGAFGLVLKPGASIWGLPGYTFKGIYMEITKHFGKSTQNYIIAARTAQGYEEWKVSSAGERERIIATWKSTKLETKRGNHKYGKERLAEVESHILTPTASHNHTELVSGFQNTRHLSFDDRKELDKRRQAHKKEEKERKRQEKKHSIAGYRHVPGDPRSPSASQSNVPTSSADLLSANEADFEEAIKRSVTKTSQGNPREDAIIERALRASVKSLRNNPEPITDENQEEAFQRAVQASMEEAYKARVEMTDHSGDTAGYHADDSEEESRLSRGLTQSLDDYQHRDEKIAMVDNDYDTEDGEDFKRAVEASQQSIHKPQSRPVPPVPPHSGQRTGTTVRDRTDSEIEEEQLRQALEASLSHDHNHRQFHEHDEDDAELTKALTASEHENKNREAEIQRQKTEEEIVMEYVKKQSLLEEEHRKARHQQQQQQ